MRPSLTAAAPTRGRRLLLINAAFGRPELLFAPYGLLRLNAALHAWCRDIESRVVDCNREHAHDHEYGIDTFLGEFEPAVVGISALSAAMPWAQELAARVRTYDPEVPILLGGFHATSYPDGIANYDFDYFVCGEGTRSGAALLTYLLDGAPDRGSIPGLGYCDATGAARNTARVEPPLDLDENPPIRWSDIEAERFTDRRSSAIVGPHVRVVFPEPLASHTVAQGCPRRCAFCERISGPRLRRHSPERVVSDLRALHAALGSTWVSLGDDAITLDRDWFITLLDALAHGPPLRYVAGINADLADRELIDRMVDAGFGIIACFPESGSERVREVMGKKLNLDRLLENMEHAGRQGALVAATFILGAPGETLAEAEATVALAKQPVFDLVGFNQLILYGTTPFGCHLDGLGIEPDTPAYFDYLHKPAESCVAAYDTANLIRLSILGKRSNLEKLADARVRAKVERHGLEIELDLPDLEVEPEEEQPELEAVTITEPVKPDLLPPACADLVTALTGAELEAVSAHLERTGLRIHMHSAMGELIVWISSRDVDSYFRRSEYFALSYQGRDLSRGMERLLLGVFERLQGWEAGNANRDEVRALVSASA